mmetsp:Transcript_1212/g.3798  ORF Transcript_1212/g.3798 Transcript_1212/m.3798 type:complete len:241 (+) Transcript_1212:559-1281(+)
MRPISSSGHVLTISSAVVFALSPMRMSSGPSFINENPRSARSRCIELTPKSSNILSTPSTFNAFNASRICLKFASTKLNFNVPVARAFAAAFSLACSNLGCANACADRSTSNPINCSISACRVIIAAACPPAPSVPSTCVRVSTSAKHSKISSSITLTCGAPSASTALPALARWRRPRLTREDADDDQGRARRRVRRAPRARQAPPPHRAWRVRTNAADDTAEEDDAEEDDDDDEMRMDE